MSLIQFTHSYNDLSADTGFQFKFSCGQRYGAKFCAECGMKQ